MAKRLTLVTDSTTAALGAGLTPARQRLLDAAAAIRAEPEKVEWAFMARQLVQCTLPHRNPDNESSKKQNEDSSEKKGSANKKVWKRLNGNLTLSVVPGTNSETGDSYGFPYGVIPRLLLFWIVTEAKRTSSRRLELGHSLAQFMHAIGLNADTGGGKRGDAARLRDQMQRLFRATISFQHTVNDGSVHGVGWRDMQVTSEGELWWDTRSAHQGFLWGSWIELGEKFFEAIMAAPVPYDMRALRALKRSPLALDIYAVLNYRAYTAKEPLFLSWEMLMGQLGADLGTPNNFRLKMVPVLRKVMAVQPHLKVSRTKGGIIIQPSRPAISPKQIA